MQEFRHSLKVEPPASLTDPGKRKVFFGLFVFPMLIAVTMAVLLSGIVLLTHEEETPESLITAIKTGAPSKRWQKAFELSNELNREGGMLRSAGIMNEVIHILNDKEHYDAKTRAYMAMALGRFQNEQARSALLEALRKIDDSEDPQVALFVMWALGGQISSPHPNLPPQRGEGITREIVPFLESKHDDLRKTAAYVLGVIHGTRYVTGLHSPVIASEAKQSQTGDYFVGLRPPRNDDAFVLNALKHALEDPVIDVRWNAALSLARLGDDSGREILLQMLDRKQLREVQQLNEVEIERVMVNAIKGVSLIQSIEGRLVLERLANNDPNLKVREAALQALNSPSLRGSVA